MVLSGHTCTCSWRCALGMSAPWTRPEGWGARKAGRMGRLCASSSRDNGRSRARRPECKRCKNCSRTSRPGRATCPRPALAARCPQGTSTCSRQSTHCSPYRTIRRSSADTGARPSRTPSPSLNEHMNEWISRWKHEWARAREPTPSTQLVNYTMHTSMYFKSTKRVCTVRVRNTYEYVLEFQGFSTNTVQCTLQNTKNVYVCSGARRSARNCRRTGTCTCCVLWARTDASSWRVQCRCDMQCCPIWTCCTV